MNSDKDELLLVDNSDRTYNGLKLIESFETPTGEYTNAVIARLEGPLSDFTNPSRNDRGYERELWAGVLASDYIKEHDENKTLLGEPDHPMKVEDRSDIHIPYVSHAISSHYIRDDLGCVWGTVDILDTPYGRIVKTLIDYGSKLGISSRGSGKVITKNGKKIVDRTTYRFITWDIVIMPGHKRSRLSKSEVANESLDIAMYEAFKNIIDSAIEDKDTDRLKLVESLLSNVSFDNSDSLTALMESYFTESLDNTIVDDGNSDLDEAYRAIAKYKSDNRILSESNERLISYIDELRQTISDLSASNKVLSEKVLESIQNPVVPATPVNESVRDSFDRDFIRKEINSLADLILDAISESAKVSTTPVEVIRESVDYDEVISRVLENVTKSDLNQSGIYLEKLKSTESMLSESDNHVKELKSKLNESNELAQSFIDGYLSIRCKQLGLSESVVRSTLGSDLKKFNPESLNKHLNEMYVAKPSSTPLGEGAKVVPGKMTGKVISESLDESEDYESLNDTKGLSNAIRSLRGI